MYAAGIGGSEAGCPRSLWHNLHFSPGNFPHPIGEPVPGRKRERKFCTNNIRTEFFPAISYVLAFSDGKPFLYSVRRLELNSVFPYFYLFIATKPSNRSIENCSFLGGFCSKKPRIDAEISQKHSSSTFQRSKGELSRLVE